MQVYKAPIQDMMFCLETMGYDRVRDRPLCRH